MSLGLMSSGSITTDLAYRDNYINFFSLAMMMMKTRYQWSSLPQSDCVSTYFSNTNNKLACKIFY